MTNSTFEPSTFTPVEPADGFLQLSPIGVFPHPRGLQNVDRSALENVVKNFNSILARIGRRFAGLPFYVGHPDAPGFENLYPDHKAYGWILDLQVRDDGLYGRAKWSAAGRDLIANGHFKFLSPYWEAEQIGTSNGRSVFRPTVLRSVGLTNQPNLPVPPLANSEPLPADDTLIGTFLRLPGTPPDHQPLPNDPCPSTEPPAETTPLPAFSPSSPRSPSAPLENSPLPNSAHTPPAVTTPRESIPSQTLRESPSPSPTGGTMLRESIPSTTLRESPSPLFAAPSPSTEANPQPPSPHDALTLRTAHLEALLENCREQMTRLNQRLISTLLDTAIASARILPAERSRWAAELETSFESASVQLANAKPKLNLTAKTDCLAPGDHPLTGSADRQKQILTLVNERMHRTGESYDTAWLQTKDSRPDLFARP